MKALVLLAAFLLAGFSIWLTNWLALIPWRRSRGEHWTERARILWPVRRAVFLNLVLAPVSLAVASTIYLPDDSPHPLLLGVVAWFGAVIGARPFETEVFPDLSFKSWLYVVIVSWLVSLAGPVILVAALIAMPREFNAEAWSIGAGVFVFYSAYCLGAGLWLVEKLGLMTSAPERLERIVAAVAQQMQVTVRRTRVMLFPQANAFAQTLTNELIFTQRLLDEHPDEEIAAICAHEIGHLQETKWLRLFRCLAALALLPVIFLRPAVTQYGFPGLLSIAALVFGISYSFRRVSRKAESRADEAAASNQAAEGVYARALARLHENNQIPAVFPNENLTHPCLYDRLIAVGAPPDYPRPKPPETSSWHGAIFWTAFFILVFVYFWRSL